MNVNYYRVLDCPSLTIQRINVKNSNNYYTEVKEILESDKSYKYKNINTKYNLSISFIKAEYYICKFDMSVSYWGSYDGDFKRACVVLGKPLINSFSYEDIKRIKRIEKKLKKIILKP